MSMIRLHRLTELDWCEGSGDVVCAWQAKLLSTSASPANGTAGVALLLEGRHGHANITACVSF